MPSRKSRPSWPISSMSPSSECGEPFLKRTLAWTRSPGLSPPRVAKLRLPFRRSAKTLPPADMTSRAPSRRTTVPRTFVPRDLPSRFTAAPENVPSGNIAPRTTTVLPTRRRLKPVCTRTVRTVPLPDAVTIALRVGSLATMTPRKVAAPAVAGRTTIVAAAVAPRSSRNRFIRCASSRPTSRPKACARGRLDDSSLSAAVGRQPHSCSRDASACGARALRRIPPTDHRERGMPSACGRYREAELLGGRVTTNRPQRHEQDLDVEPERPVLDVVVVPLDAVAERGLAAQAVHLGPARDP